jgi:hypothetical protein
MKHLIIPLILCAAINCGAAENLSFSGSRIKAEGNNEAVFIKANAGDLILNFTDILAISSDKSNVSKTVVTIKVLRSPKKDEESVQVIPYTFDFDFQSDAEKFMDFLWKCKMAK